MIQLAFGKGSVTIDFNSGNITSVKYGSAELANEAASVFKAALRNTEGEPDNIDAREATLNALTVNGGEKGFFRAEAVYGFKNGPIVTIRAEVEEEALNWSAEVNVSEGQYLEWIELPCVTLKPLKGEGGEASVLFPYNEGVIVDSMTDRLATHFRPCPVEYPSLGGYDVFPNMVCSQFLAYLMPGYGLYMGAHDPERGFKYIDFSGNNGGIGMHIRIYPADKSGDDISYAMDFPVVWKFFDGSWEDAAEIYREWFESALPPDVVKISENDRLPGWYEEMPLVVSYPVRGIHDMDEMKPNALFPYTNGLGLIGTVERATGAEILTLLMHWEGTAPWAPPYVWPPYGGEEDFNEFRDALHERGDMLGVYCSGFGYTEKSNLNDYSCAEEYEKQGLEKAMCAGPDGKVLHSRICTGQRVGYDICPASAEGDKILDEAYAPLFKAGIDYAQILDQNHGGGQYLCYSSRHGHPPVPGRWMTKSMQKLLKKWKDNSPGMLLGCESASAEPFIAYLPFSDNRFELNWHFGRPVPLCSYIYHEYAHNFMGNQVSSPFLQTENTLFLRMAYSFAAGDCLTLVFAPDGLIMDHWGGRDFVNYPNTGEVLSFVKNLTELSRGEAKAYLSRGRMVKPLKVDCPSRGYRTYSRTVDVPDVFTAAYTLDGETVQVLVNHTALDVECLVGDNAVAVPARNAVLIHL